MALLSQCQYFEDEVCEFRLLQPEENICIVPVYFSITKPKHGVATL